MKKKTSQTSASKNQLAKALHTVINAMPKFVTIIASIAIVAHICAYFDVTTRVWYTTLLAGVTGLTALILPALAKRVKPLWSIVSTGITLLLLQVLPEWLTKEDYFVAALVSVIAIFSEVFSNQTTSTLDWSNSFFKIFISAIAGVLISKLENELATVIILIIAYLVMSVIDFSFKFSIRGLKAKVKGSENADQNENGGGKSSDPSSKAKVKESENAEQNKNGGGKSSESSGDFITPTEEPKEYIDIYSK